MIITISGELGSGKTSVATRLAEDLGYAFLSMGALQRELAKSYGMDVLEFNQYCESHPEIDRERDAKLVEIAKRTEHMVIDSRLAWSFLPEAIKIHLIVDPAIAADRVFHHQRASEAYESVEDALSKLKERKRSELDRFKSIYQVDLDRYANYDAILNSSLVSVEAVLAKCKDCVSDRSHHGFWVSPKMLFPLKPIKEIQSPPSDSTQVSPSSPLRAIHFRGQYFLLDGYAEWMTAHRNHTALIPLKLIAEDDALDAEQSRAGQYVLDHVASVSLKDWEDALGFEYHTHPSCDSPALED